MTLLDKAVTKGSHLVAAIYIAMGAWVTWTDSAAGDGVCCRAAFCNVFARCTLFCWRVLLCSPNRTARNMSIPVILSIGTHFGCCLMALPSLRAASRILSAGVRVGMAMA